MGGHLRILVLLPVSAWLVKAERVGAGPSQDGWVQFLWFFDRGGVVIIYCVRRIVGMEKVCFAGKIFYISINNLY